MTDDGINMWNLCSCLDQACQLSCYDMCFHIARSDAKALEFFFNYKIDLLGGGDEKIIWVKHPLNHQKLQKDPHLSHCLELYSPKIYATLAYFTCVPFP